VYKRQSKGRRTHWILKKSPWDRQCFLLPHQKALIILLLLTTEDIFIELLKDDIENILIRCDFKKAFLDYIAKDIHIKYFYGIHPEHVLSILSKIVLAIENENYINLTYKKTKNFERVLPIGLGMRRGKIYLIAYEEQGEKRTIALENITSITILNLKYSGSKFPKPEKFLTFVEKPFVFGLILNKDTNLDSNILTFHPLIFKAEVENNIIREIYLVGFDGDYFAKRFLNFPFENFIPPDAKLLILAKKKRLDKQFPQLVLDDLNENLKRFENFVENLREVLKEKYQNVENFWRDWNKLS
jgi:hypothetical protein